MPKKDIDYSKTIIYKIVCDDLNIKDCYVGHTTDLTKRKNSHKHACNTESCRTYNLRVYQMIRTNGGWDNWTILEIEKYPCADVNEAKSRERHWYEITNSSLNARSPYKRLVNDSERAKQWREINKDFICTCGKTTTRGNINRHQKSKYHIMHTATSTTD